MSDLSQFLETDDTCTFWMDISGIIRVKTLFVFQFHTHLSEFIFMWQWIWALLGEEALKISLSQYNSSCSNFNAVLA